MAHFQRNYTSSLEPHRVYKALSQSSVLYKEEVGLIKKSHRLFNYLQSFIEPSLLLVALGGLLLPCSPCISDFHWDACCSLAILASLISSLGCLLLPCSPSVWFPLGCLLLPCSPSISDLPTGMLAAPLPSQHLWSPHWDACCSLDFLVSDLHWPLSS